jgi:hypothetical protein
MMKRMAAVLTLAGACAAAAATRPEVPARYYVLMDSWIRSVEARMNTGDKLTLASLESTPDWRHFPSAILAAAVLYAKEHPANPRFHDPGMLRLALRIGDLLADENEAGAYTQRLDYHRDTYMWIDAYRLLEPELGEARGARWRRSIEPIVGELARNVAVRTDFPRYQSPFITTSPNHLCLWASTVYLAGQVFKNDDWVKTAGPVLHRFGTAEQTADGYWGEHSDAGPTTGYDYVTYTGMALYAERSGDAEVQAALRRGLDFHENFTWPDGTPVEVVNDRNRHWTVSQWGHFGFSRYPDGRRYAAFLSGFCDKERFSLEDLGRTAQNALYFHEGPLEPIPQDRDHYLYRMKVPAQMRKTGPWVVGLSGLISTQAPLNQFYLDRQAHLSIFHQNTGLIISGANSKRQPELATFFEKIKGEFLHLPLSSRLQPAGEQDRLSLSYNTFFAELYVSPPSQDRLDFRFDLTGTSGAVDEARLNFQLRLKPGEILETAAGPVKVGSERVEIASTALGGWVRHGGWTIRTDGEASLAWPVYPFNPYANAPEKLLEHAVAVLSVPVKLHAGDEDEARVRSQHIRFTVQVPAR